jgi:hypothetical protein
VSIAEIDFGVSNPRQSPRVDTQCRSDLLQVNSIPVSVRLVNVDNALDTTQSFSVEACENITLTSGENLIRTAKGLDTGLDLDQLTLTSTNTPLSAFPYAPLTITSQSRTRLTALTETDTPHIVSFGQSINTGWKATLRTSKGTLDLGDPFVVQGYANGWLVPESGELILEWTPQRFVRGSLLMSGIITVGLFFAAFRRRTRTGSAHSFAEVLPSPKARRPLFILMLATLVVGFAGVIPAVATAVFLALPRRYSMVLIGILVGAIAGAIIVAQTRYGYPPAWPLRLEELTPLTWTAVAVACINPLLRRN